MRPIRPSPGQSFTILMADDVDGAFATEVLPCVPGLIFDVIYNPQSIVLTVNPAFTADFDEDGDDLAGGKATSAPRLIVTPTTAATPTAPTSSPGRGSSAAFRRHCPPGVPSPNRGRGIYGRLALYSSP